jgi:hypothetical protein
LYETPIIIELIIANTGENLKKNDAEKQPKKIIQDIMSVKLFFHISLIVR